MSVTNIRGSVKEMRSDLQTRLTMANTKRECQILNVTSGVQIDRPL